MLCWQTRKHRWAYGWYFRSNCTGLSNCMLVYCSYLLNNVKKSPGQPGVQGAREIAERRDIHPSHGRVMHIGAWVADDTLHSWDIGSLYYPMLFFSFCSFLLLAVVVIFFFIIFFFFLFSSPFSIPIRRCNIMSNCLPVSRSRSDETQPKMAHHYYQGVDSEYLSSLTARLSLKPGTYTFVRLGYE